MLITTKLQTPPLRANALPRPHLVDRLSAGRDRRLIVITGPAGSGKTSLVLQWIKRDAPRAAWYALDKKDNDIGLFFQYLLAAFRGLDSRFAESGAWPETAALSAADFIPSLVDSLTVFQEDVYIVLDHYHLVTAPQVHRALVLFLDHAPRNVHIVVVSQHAVPFSLSRFKCRNQIVEIQWDDLKFSHKETERYFREMLPVRLSLGQIQELSRQMEGWVGGLQLFAFSLRGKDTIDGFAGVLGRACDQAADYLIDEAVSIQPKTVKRFLCATALLERFTPELCPEVAEGLDAFKMLEYVQRHNLFLTPLDADGAWYRYHRLLSKAIKKMMARSFPQEYVRIYRAAARWFAERGYLEDAFRHAFASRDMEFAADMLEEHLITLYQHGDVAAFRRWLSKLPRDVFTRRPLLRLQECWFRTATVELSRAAELMTEIEKAPEEAFARYDARRRRLCRDFAALLKNVLPQWLDPETADIAKLREALLGISSIPPDLSDIVKMFVVSSYHHQGELGLACQALDESAPTFLSSKRPLDAVYWHRIKAALERFQGRLSRSQAVLEDAFLFLDRRGLSKVAPKFLLYLPMAWNSYLRNDLEKALEYATISLKYVGQTGYVYEISEVNYLLALVHLGRGELEKTQQCMRRMQRGRGALAGRSWVAMTEAHLARLSLLQGDLAWAEEWVERRKLRFDEPFTFRFVPECLTHAELYCALGRCEDAAEMLEKLQRLCSAKNMREAILEIDIIRSGVYYALDNRPKASAVMRTALAFSKTEGYIRPFVNHAPAISRVLTEVAKTAALDPDPAWTSAIIGACGIGREEAMRPAGAVPGNRLGDLTRREMDILELMSAGYKNKEIAERAFISLDTVKTHTKHIYAKLEAKTRIQAVRRADQIKARKPSTDTAENPTRAKNHPMG